FLQDEDRSRCRSFHEELEYGRWKDMDFVDPRLHALAQRLKARSFPQLLDEGEMYDWRSFVNQKLTGEGDWLNLDAYDHRLTQMAAEAVDNPAHLEILHALMAHGADVRMRYGI
ncbi:MAG: hypothetical protein AAF513_15185, partial [Pseudomonadota bacterium]